MAWWFRQKSAQNREDERTKGSNPEKFTHTKFGLTDEISARNSRAVSTTRADVIGAVNHERPLEVRSKFIAYSLIAFIRSCDTGLQPITPISWYPMITSLCALDANNSTRSQQTQYTIQVSLRVFYIGVVI